LNGSYATNLTQLTFSQVATTQAACTSQALQTQEQALLAMMAVPQTYQVFDTSMQISGTTGVFNFSITPLTRPDEVAIPVAIIKAPADARVNTPVTFDGSQSTSELPLVRYSWDFGDGGRATGAVVQHVYRQTGTFRVLLSVFDQANQGNTGSTQITIWQEVTPTAQPTKPVPPTGTPVPPEPTRTVEPTKPVEPTPLPTNTPAPDQPTAVPPTEVPTEAPTAVPTEEPTPPPSVPPTAAVNGPSTGFIGEPVSFSAAGSTAGSSPIVSYSWDFGDGGRSSAGPDVSYLYNHSGSYTVNVIVTDQAGLSSSASLQINIDARLDTTVWTLSNVNPGTAITLQFLNGQIAGFAGCNTYTGSYTATDNGDGTYTVTPSGFNVSRLSCPQSIMDQENDYLSALQQVTTASVQGSMLSLTGGGSPLTYYEVGSPQPR
jgi:PKD repeat protein